ncbi:uncharacterized protein F5891DRAFT_50580 [Suillus fuscotomentosus]|uniref:Uncharacterized protein n=1 Tax=Suillus fuscotomentosus TaxID=1912939 RepID=A0AAD4DST3_9AGAM|nr:uncharacterized protein F5891DRAFT_50580 [Suillus fuscotomentosus]KAG1893176.1 hypothetical protein F5891DRAFT_50580 [Suillus fuscotomentosus]
MARTKQTAGNSTGGPARRGHLPIFKKVTGHAGKQLIKTVQATPPRVKIMPKPNSHNIFCFFCCDGGSLYDCTVCPRSVCDRCIVIPPEFQELIMDPGVYFICPGCHEMRTKGDAMKPYFAFENASGQGVLPTPVTIHGHIEVTSRSQICSSPVLILHFVIKGLDPSGSPATSMQQQLRPFKPQNNMQYHEIIFDIGTGKKAEKHLTTMKQLVTRIKLLQCERVEVFVFSHSSTTEGSRGDIWGGYADDESSGRGRNKVVIEGGPVAYTVNDVCLSAASRITSKGLPCGCSSAVIWYKNQTRSGHSRPVSKSMKSSMHSHLVPSDFTHAWSYHLSALTSAVYLLKGSRCRMSFETSSWHPLGLECIRPLSIYTGQMPSVAAQPPYQSTPKD